jgi:hypothetical protein
MMNFIRTVFSSSQVKPSVKSEESSGKCVACGGRMEGLENCADVLIVRWGFRSTGT